MSGGSMPFSVARRNQIFGSVVGSTPTAATGLERLKRLLNGQQLWGPTPLPKPSTMGSEAAQHHVQYHWFGNPPVDANKKVGPPSQTDQVRTTGWWEDWFGDAHEIVRQTMQRAYQVSLGIAGADLTLAKLPADATGLRCWPITILWVCGAPLFNGYVVWDAHGGPAADGHVTVIFGTPETDSSYKDPDAAYNPAPFPKELSGVGNNEWFELPDAIGNQHEMVVIGHKYAVYQRLVHSISSKGNDVYIDATDPALVKAVVAPGKYDTDEALLSAVEKAIEKRYWKSGLYRTGTKRLPEHVRVGFGAVLTVNEPKDTP